MAERVRMFWLRLLDRVMPRPGVGGSVSRIVTMSPAEAERIENLSGGGIASESRAAGGQLRTCTVHTDAPPSGRVMPDPMERQEDRR